MPTYQYACTECGHHFEQFQSFSDDALTHCPTCDGRVRKVFNAVGVVFKGSGFYRNDSRSNGTKPAEAKSGESAGASDSGGSTEKAAKADPPAAKTDTSPAAKPAGGSSAASAPSSS